MAISRFKTSTLAQGLPKYQKLWDGTSAVATPVFDSIATITLSASATTFSFTSIPSTYKHLQLRFKLRTDSASTENLFKMSFNNDSGANYYDLHYVYGDTTSAAAGGSTVNATFMYGERAAGGSATANVFGAGIVDILDYTNTNKNKTMRIFTGMDRNGGGNTWLTSALWKPSTPTAINRVDVFADTGNFTQYSQVALYGIKG